MPKQAKSCLISTFSSMNHILNDTFVILNVLLKHVLMKKKKNKQNVILTKDLYMNQKVFISILYLSILIHYNVLTQLR